MKTEILEQLMQLAFDRTTPFCYGCYQEAPTSKCKHCGSDDLMRLLPGAGCEYGTDWVIQHILKEELEPVNLDEAFENSIRECYPETIQVGWMTLDTVDTMKESDPVSWRCAMSEWESNEESEENIISFDYGSNYFWKTDLENLVQ